MALKIGVRSQGAVTILDLKGAISIGETEDAFRDRITRLIKEKKSSILLNLEHVEFIDSSGVGALIGCLTSVVKAGGKLKGLKPTPMVQKLLKITGVYKLIEFFEDEEAALASF